MSRIFLSCFTIDFHIYIYCLIESPRKSKAHTYETCRTYLAYLIKVMKNTQMVFSTLTQYNSIKL